MPPLSVIAMMGQVIHLKVRFLGITARGKTSPNTWRCRQDAHWTGRLPHRAIANVSIEPWLWRYLGDEQDKLTLSFRRTRWAGESVTHPARDDRTLTALAQAVAIVEQGRSREVRTAPARLIGAEPTFGEPWLRSPAPELRR
ncbi:hypothetical protein [Streptosporangium sp. NPDC051022]|uniref:hypothetical protein n=1 Tax=Streptosporangium sp. NPDC051022 TaxID=3155752 RepID=UPI0034296CFA